MSGSSPELRIRLEPSVAHAAIVIGGMVLGTAAVLSSGLFPVLLKLSICVVLSLCTLDWVRRYMLLTHEDAVTGISFKAGKWRLLHPSRAWVRARLLEPVYYNRCFIVMRFRTANRTLPVVISRDSLGDRAFRRCAAFFRLADYTARS